MTLDREAARALFDNADSTPQPTVAPARADALYVEPRAAVYTPTDSIDDTAFIAGSSPYERLNGGGKARKGVDWRIVAPIGVAALCAGAVALFVIPNNNETVEGKSVAASEITAPPIAQPVAPPADLATAETATPAAPMAAAPAPAPAPVVERAASRPAPVAVRRAPARQVAAAPSVEDNSSNVSAREPYIPTPTLGAPTAVTLTPATPAPPPVMQPTPPVAEPEPQR